MASNTPPRVRENIYLKTRPAPLQGKNEGSAKSTAKYKAPSSSVLPGQLPAFHPAHSGYTASDASILSKDLPASISPYIGGPAAKAARRITRHCQKTIQRLHTYDWAEFNRERRYLQRQVEWSPYVDLVSAQDLELPVEDVESLMDSIEDMELLRILSKEDKLTIQIAFLKMSGYNGYEIAEKTGLTQKAVNLRMVRLRKKLKKFFEA